MRAFVPAVIAVLLAGGLMGSTRGTSSGDPATFPPRGAIHDYLASGVEARQAPAPPQPAIRPVTSAPPPVTPVGPFSMPHANRVMLPSVGIDLPVRAYSDCDGKTPMPEGMASRDGCAAATTVYLMGHNPGVFSALPAVRNGALVRYWDGSGQAFTYRVTSVGRQARGDRTEINALGPPHLDFQTCANADGSIVWMVIAYPI